MANSMSECKYIAILLFCLGFKGDVHPITELINDHRRKWNAKELVEDERLECAAKMQLKHIRATRTCTHLGLNGETPRDRSIACGYPWTYGDQLLVCQYLTEEAWIDTLPAVPKQYRILRDHGFKHIGVAGDELWWVVILAR